MREQIAGSKPVMKFNPEHTNLVEKPEMCQEAGEGFLGGK
jgi:hypothetical protein